MDADDRAVSEIIEGKLYFAALQRQADVKVSSFPRPVICFNVDNELVYKPFHADFGPLNLACTYRFCRKLYEMMKEAEDRGRCVCFCCSTTPKKKANAAVLVGCYLVIFEDRDVDYACNVLEQCGPYLPFRDPAPGKSTYHLSVNDCIRGIANAKKLGWIDFKSFNVEDYEYHNKVENGDINWIIPKKLVAFSGPGARRTLRGGYRTLGPEHYVDYFKKSGVSTVIRLSKRIYDKRSFTDHGFAFYDLYFPDGSCPPDSIIQIFFESIEGSSGAVAVHCKAGLGRTGVLIGCYIMKHYRFTANEALGYLRIVRPGSVIGPQQRFLREVQSRLWKAGELLRHQMVGVNNGSRNLISPFSKNNVASGGADASLLTSISAKMLNKGNSQTLKKYTSNAMFRKTSLESLDDLSKKNSCISKNFRPNNSALQIREIRNLESEGELPNDIRSSCGSSFLTPSSRKLAWSSASVSSNIFKVSVAVHDDFYTANTYETSATFKKNLCMYHSDSCPAFQFKNINTERTIRNKDIGPKIFSRDFCTQRVINSSGQPSKFLVPFPCETQYLAPCSSEKVRFNARCKTA
eukprot:TRINITY_DN4199_c0_g1_i12.p1 TRINITY_DN4199_c0_g1~~TRINITY_DN4199_c0_g1_i12.p1  ORF type:complete len:577 (+),score=41.26 TRINITY_DN4199_c0_g1_i12:322-2052(+)